MKLKKIPKPPELETPKIDTTDYSEIPDEYVSFISTKFKVLECDKTYTYKVKYDKETGTVTNPTEVDENGEGKSINLFGLFDLRPQTKEQKAQRAKMPFEHKFDYCWKISVLEMGSGLKHYTKNGKLNYRFVWNLALYTNDCETWLSNGDIIQVKDLKLKKPTFKNGTEMASALWLESRDYKIVYKMPEGEEEV